MKKKISVIKKKTWFEIIEKRLTEKVEKLPPLRGVIDIKEKEKIEKVLSTLNEVLRTKNVELEKLLQFLRNPQTLIYLQGSALRKDEYHPTPPKDIDVLLLTKNEYLPKPIYLKKKFEIEKREIRLDINIYRQHGYQLPLIGRSLPECIVAELMYKEGTLWFKEYCTFNPEFIREIMEKHQIPLPALFKRIPYFLNPYHAFLSKSMPYKKLPESIVNKNPDIADKVIEDMLESVDHYEPWVSQEDILKTRHAIQSIKKNLKISNDIPTLEKELSDIAEELRKIEEEEKENIISELKNIIKELRKVRKIFKKISATILKGLEEKSPPKEVIASSICSQESPLTEKKERVNLTPEISVFTVSLVRPDLEKKSKKTETKAEKNLREWEAFKDSFSNPKGEGIGHVLYQCKQVIENMAGLDPEDIAKSLLDFLKRIAPFMTEKTIKRFSQEDYEAYHDILLFIAKKKPETDLFACLIPHEFISLEDSLIGSCHKIKYLTMVLKWLITRKPLRFEEEFIQILDKIISLETQKNTLAEKMLDLYFNPCLFDQGNDELNKMLWKFFSRSIIPYMEKLNSIDHKKILPSIKWGLNHGCNEVFSYLIKFQKFIPYELLKPTLESVIKIDPDTDEETLEKKSETVTLISLYLTSRIAEVALKKTKPDMPFLDLIEATLGYFKEFISRLSKHSINIRPEGQLRLYTIPLWKKIAPNPTVSAAIVILKRKEDTPSSSNEDEEQKILNEVLPFLKIQSFNILKSMILLIIGALRDSSIKESKSDLEKKLPRFLGMIEEFERINQLVEGDAEERSGIEKSEFRSDLIKIVNESEKEIYQSNWFSSIRKVVFKETLLGIPLLFERTNLEEIKEKIHIFFSITLDLSSAGFHFKNTQKVGLHYRSHILDEIHILFRESFTGNPMIKHEHHLDIFLIFCHDLLKVLEKTNAQVENWYQAEKAKLKIEDEETQAMLKLIKEKELPLVNAPIKLTGLEKKKLKGIEALHQECKDKIELEIQANSKKPNLLNGLHQEILIALKFLQLLHYLNKKLAEEKIKEVLEKMAKSFQVYMKTTQSMAYDISSLDESNKKLHGEIERKLQKVCT